MCVAVSMDEIVLEVKHAMYFIIKLAKERQSRQDSFFEGLFIPSLLLASVFSRQFSVLVGQTSRPLNILLNNGRPAALSGTGRGKAEREAVGLPPRPGEVSGLHVGKLESGLDGMTKETGKQKKN